MYPMGNLVLPSFIALRPTLVKGRRLEVKKLQHITGWLKGKWATQNLGQVSSKPAQKK
jgi:hypothetical protein